MIPDGFTARPATEADAPAATAAINACDVFHLGADADEQSVEDTLGWWETCDLERYSLVVHEGDRLVGVGLLDVDHHEPFLDAYVAPGATGRGLGSAFAAWGEAGARDHGRSTVRAGYLAVDAAAGRLFRGRGYEYVRSFYRMVADLDEPPPAPAWPAGCSVSGGDERDFYTVIDGAFVDHWGYTHRPFEVWIRPQRAEQPDPELWFLVRVDGELAAASICGHRFGQGFVGMLGVLPAWRRRGLGRALLLHSFGELYARGERRMGLGVDATNESGAVGLYESVGMRVAARIDMADLAL